MATSLDMSLDDLIKSRGERGRGRGRGGGRGGNRGDGQRFGRISGRGRGFGTFRGRGGMPSRRPLGVNTQSSSHAFAKSFNKAKDMIWRNDLFEDSLVAAGLSGVESGTKLYISNLHYGVTKDDIKELFSEMGNLKHCAVHYNNNGRPTGSAEVVFSRKNDAIAALKRYNNVLLDGKAMKIEVIGINLGSAAAPRVNVVAGGRGRGKRTVVMMPEFRQGAAGSSNHAPWGRRGDVFQRGRGQGRGRGAGRSLGRGLGRGRSFGRGLSRGRGWKGPAVKSAEEMDKDLDNYHSEAMNIE